MAFKMKYGKNLPFDYGNGSHLKQVAPIPKTGKEAKEGELEEKKTTTIGTGNTTTTAGQVKGGPEEGLEQANKEIVGTTPAEDPVEPLSTRIANDKLTQEERDAIRLAEIKRTRERLNKGK